VADQRPAFLGHESPAIHIHLGYVEDEFIIRMATGSSPQAPLDTS
jgi:hypothetical protein